MIDKLVLISHQSGTFIKKSNAAISLVAHKNESPAPTLVFFPHSPAVSSVLGILYARARDVGLTAGGAVDGMVLTVKELERDGRDFKGLGCLNSMVSVCFDGVDLL